MLQAHFLRLALLAGAAALLACDDGTGPDSDPIAAVSVAPDSSHIVVGEELQITATVLRADGETVDSAPVWSAEPEGVVQVDGTGRVLALDAGRAEVTATIGDVTGVAVVHVESPPNVTVSPRSAIVPVGGRVTVMATVLGGVEPSLSWSSSDETVVSVDPHGRATGTGVGTAWVVAGVVDWPSVRDSAEIRVIDGQSLYVSPQEPVICSRDQVQMEAVGFPGPVTWESSNEQVATIDGSGLATASAAGSTLLTARALDAPAVTASTTLTVFVPVGGVPSIAAVRGPAGETLDLQNISGEITVTVNADVSPTCTAAAEIVLLVDSTVAARQAYTGGPLQWRPTIDSRQYANGEHRLGAEIRAADGSVLGSASQVLVRFNN